MTQQNDEALNKAIEAAGEELTDPETLKQALADEQEKARDYLSSWQRAQADFINYKKRNEQERAELSSVMKANAFYTILPVLDDLERALESVPPDQQESGWVAGIKLIVRNFCAILEAQAVSPIKALGEPFDPRFHEAVRQGKGKEGVVIAEEKKGYMLNNILIRPSMVVVGNGEED